MLMTAIGIFSLTAILGMLLLSYVLTNKDTPKGISFIHGPLGAIGIIILLVYAFIHNHSPIVSLTLFILAALGGFMLIHRDITGKPLPYWLAIGHGLTALTGFIFLLIFTFMN